MIWGFKEECDDICMHNALDMGKWSFGHPAARLLPDNKLLLAYYAGTPDCMSIHWARVTI